MGLRPFIILYCWPRRTGVLGRPPPTRPSLCAPLRCAGPRAVRPCYPRRGGHTRSRRRAGVAAALALLLMATPLAGVAYAKIVSGTPGNDYLLGTTKKDLIRGLEKDDYIRALAGEDLLYGGAGDDVVRGGNGNDQIFPGEGPDIVLAGAGNDKIYARDAGSLDSIDCGGGFDKVETIHRDDRTLENCERTPGQSRGNIF
jgi:hypothetical protein